MLAAVEGLCRDVGERILEARGSGVRAAYSVKADRSLVTAIDEMSEELLIEGLGRILLRSRFLAEESHSELEGKLDRLWIVDPIDGTTNFIHGIPAFAISIALYMQGKAVLGTVYDVASGIAYSACEGMEGITINGIKAAGVSATERLGDALLATGFPISAIPELGAYIEVLKRLMPITHGIRRIGAAALDLAWVASGRFDGFFEYNLKPWDVAAGAYLVQKAGGQVSGLDGNPDFLFSRQILASNGHLHLELTNAVA